MNIVTEPEFVVGVDFGAVSSEVSIAHVNDPLNIYTVNIWGQAEETSVSHPRRYHTSILYIKDGEKKILCGAHSPYVAPEDIYIPSIKQYLFNLELADERLGMIKEGLTIQKVVTDYLECFIKLALERFQIHDRFRQSKHFRSSYNLDNVSNIRYRVACPNDLQTFMTNCFLGAGIIEDYEKEQRLSFITDVEAIAYNQVALNRESTKFIPGQSYLVCDVGEISIGLAKVNVDTTESLSTVKLFSENSNHGSTHLEVNFRNYLEENSTELHLNQTIIDNLVIAFLQDVKYKFHEHPRGVSFGILNTEHNPISIPYADLIYLVFLPVIEDIGHTLLDALEKNSDCKLILSGKYAADTFFNANLRKILGRNNDFQFLKESYPTIASGAVSSALRPSKLQVPFVITDPTQLMLDDHGSNINKNNEKYDFIIGIDYGTAFSGCSYVNLKNRSNRINTIFDKWPGGSSFILGKTPTLVAHDKKNKPVYWGEEAKLKAPYNKHLNFFENFKFYLSSENSGQFNDDTRGYLDFSEEPKSPGEIIKENKEKQDFGVSIISSYLKVFKNHVLEYIIDRETDDTFTFYNKGKLLEKYKVKYVIAVPAMWGLEAIETMKKAATDAIVTKENETHDILVITEPEAAALSCEKKFVEWFDKPDGTNFIVCDAGAGTVDLMAFQLDVKERLDEFDDIVSDSTLCAIGGNGLGGMCGSNCLDTTFKNYLLNFYNDMGVDINFTEVNFDKAVEHFKSCYQKNDFMIDSNDIYYDISLPISIPDEKINQSTTYRLFNHNKTLRISNREIQIKVFDPVIDRISDLLYRQKRQVEKSGDRKIDYILLSGGFSQSKYLIKRISDEFEGKCAIRTPVNSTGISQGAVSFGLNPCMISKGYAGQSIAMEVHAPFEKTDTASYIPKIVNGPHGTKYAKNSLDYFVKLGQELHNGQCSIYTKIVHVEYPKEAVIAIFSCDSRKGSDSKFITSSHKKILEARVVTPPFVNGIEEGEMIEFEVSLQMIGSIISVTVECQNALINDNIKMAASDKKLSIEFQSNCTLNLSNKKPSSLDLASEQEISVYGLRVKSSGR